MISSIQMHRIRQNREVSKLLLNIDPKVQPYETAVLKVEEPSLGGLI